MKLSANRLRGMCPALPEQPADVRRLLDKVGIECESLELVDGDLVADVELLANRGDHRGYLGVARELCATLDIDLVMPTMADVAALRVRGEDRFDDAVLVFATLTVEDSSGDPLALVEVGNDVAVEFGQPLHIFDADRVIGEVRVRRSRRGETADLIGSDGDTELPEGILLVVDDESVIAVAGVLGCRHASVSPSSRRLLVESACYDPVAVRIASNRTRFSTTASQRFERGSDQSLVVPALARFAERAAPTIAPSPGTPPHAVVIHCQRPHLPALVEASATGAAALLGTHVDAADFAARLGRLGFPSAPQDRWVVPEGRVWDVQRAADLYEEYARSVGYDELPERMPAAGLGVSPSEGQRGKQLTAEALHAAGFFEVMTDGTYGRADFDLLAPHLPAGSPIAEHVTTLHAHDSSNALLKSNVVLQALRALESNVRAADAAVRLYEFTTIFAPDESAENLVRETRVLWAIAAGARTPWDWSDPRSATDLFDGIGAIAQVADLLSWPLRTTPLGADHELAPLLHPFRSAEVKFGERAIGVVGEVHPRVVASFGLPGSRPILIQLASEALVPGPHRPARISTAPPVVRMLDLVMPVAAGARAVLEVLREASPDWLRDVYVSDVFRAGALGPDEQSVTFTFEFEPHRARRAEVVNDLMRDLVHVVRGRLGESVRLR